MRASLHAPQGSGSTIRAVHFQEGRLSRGKSAPNGHRFQIWIACRFGQTGSGRQPEPPPWIGSKPWLRQGALGWDPPNGGHPAAVEVCRKSVSFRFGHLAPFPPSSIRPEESGPGHTSARPTRLRQARAKGTGATRTSLSGFDNPIRRYPKPIRSGQMLMLRL